MVDAAGVEARKAGAPRANAATLAKDLTVNFNRKGEINPDLNLLWLFFNAALFKPWVATLKKYRQL